MDSSKYNMRTRLNGELAVRDLSKKASEYYQGTDPLKVFEYENEDGEKRYAYSYASNPYADREKVSDRTFGELQEAFEKLQVENERMLEEDGEENLTADPVPGWAEKESQEYLKKIEDTSKQLTEKEKELLSSFFPFEFEKVRFVSDPYVKAVKEKYDLSWSQLRKIAFRCISEEKTPEKSDKNNNGGFDMNNKNGYEENSRTDEYLQPDEFLTGDMVRTPRGSFYLTSMSREQMEAAGYGLHHISDYGNYYIMGNGTRAFAVAVNQPEKQPEPGKLTALLTVIQSGFVKHYDMGEQSMDDIFRQLKHTTHPFIEMKGEVIEDDGRFAELEQSGKVSVSITADIDNDSLKVYEINGVPEEERTERNTGIWHRPKMANFLRDRVREPKPDAAQYSPYRGAGRSHASEHELGM